MIALQKNIRISADDHTVFPGCSNAVYHTALLGKQLHLFRLHDGFHAEGMHEGKVVVAPVTAVQCFFHIRGIHAGCFRNGSDDFPIVIIISERVGKSFSEFSSAAAKLPSDGDDIHKKTLRR